MAMACFQLFPGSADFPECMPFPFWKYTDENSASADFTEYHKRQLEIMGIKMGRGGFDVKDLHNKKDLLAVCIGELCSFCISLLCKTCGTSSSSSLCAFSGCILRFWH
jgi:hypothetical protein